MFNKDNKHKLDTGKAESKKPKKEKSQGGKLGGESSGGGLFGGKRLGKESGKLSGSSQISEKKPKKEKNLDRKIGGSLFGGKRFEKESGKVSLGSSEGGKFAWLKWWHIVIAVVVLVMIIVGIVLAITLGGDDTPDIDDLPPEPEPEGTITTVGTFTPQSSQEFIFCEYTEYFSGEKIITLQKESEIRYNYKAYYVFVSENGIFHYDYSGEYTGEKTPEAIKTDLLNEIKSRYQYSDENIARCKVVLYQPVSFTKVKLSSVTLTSDNKVTAKYQAGATDGELSAEYTLNGTYTSADNNYTFTYTNLPEDANLRRVADELLTSAKYNYIDYYGSWMNTLTFGDKLTLSFTTDTDEPNELI